MATPLPMPNCRLGAVGQHFQSRTIRDVQDIVRPHRDVIGLAILDLLDMNGDLISFVPLRDSCA